MQKFSYGEEVMVAEKYGSRDNKYWSLKVVRVPEAVEEGYSSWSKKKVPFDPENPHHKGKTKYVGTSSPNITVACWKCSGNGRIKIESEPEILGEGVVQDPTTYKTCDKCSGRGEFISDPYIEYTVNRMDRIMPRKEWEETIGKQKEEEKRLREKRIQEQKDLEESLIDILFDSMSKSEDPKTYLAKAIKKFGYASSNNGWVNQSTIYMAASRFLEKAENTAEKSRV